MKKFKKWLDNTPGMQARLTKEVKTHRTGTSNVKQGRRPMPTSWFEVVIRLSGGLFSYEELVKERVKTQRRLTKARAEAARATQLTAAA